MVNAKALFFEFIPLIFFDISMLQKMEFLNNFMVEKKVLFIQDAFF